MNWVSLSLYRILSHHVGDGVLCINFTVRTQERKNKSLCSIIYKEQIDVNKAGIWCLARWDDSGFFIDDHCFLWHIKCHTKIDLPNFSYFKYWKTTLHKCVITPSIHEYFDNYPEDDYFCNVSLFYPEDSYCLICAPPFYKKWVKVKLYDDSRMLDAVSFCKDEKVCTLFRNGKLGIMHMVPELSTCLSPVTFRAPTDANSEYQMMQLVSWKDQLFLVQQKFGSPSVLEVWKADFETQQFNRVFNLDGFIIFLSRGFSAATSSSLPQEKNHVYFTQNNDHCTLYAFHIGDQSVSPTKQFCIFNRQNSIPLIVRSVCAKNIDSGTGNSKVKKQSSSSKCGIDTTVNCLNSKPADNNICVHLTLDLQREISRYLLSQDAYMNFRLVCKLWRSIAPPLRWKVVDHAAPPSSSSDQESMWLLSLNQNDGFCTFYNPFRKLNCYMINHDLVGCEIRYAKDGWLLVSKGKSLFFLEPSPSSKKIIHLPQRTEDYFCETLSFSASPTDSSAWVIFGITCLDLNQVRISYLRAGDDKWTSMTMDNEVSFLLSCCSPVYFGEQFCVISFDGNVGTFGFLKDGSPYWVIHEFFLLDSPRFSSYSRLFLVQRDQNMLYSVIVTQHNVHVYELDFGGDERVKLVKEVKNWLLFISETSSVAVCGMNVNVDDAVFLPQFNACNDYIYYSLEDAVFKVLKDNGTHKGPQKELLNRVWIRCELAPFYHEPHGKAEQNISMVADD
ncbi:putative xyloglucan endotransglucosylase/hydrolase protein 10-like [Capsicum annuum]|nr:putative xyloglucan endotransglucosylase/hydrolase protein 10-like [Capsicum annuum]